MEQKSPPDTPMYLHILDATLLKIAKQDLKKEAGIDFNKAVAFFFYDGGNEDRKLPFSFNSICDRLGRDPERAAKKIFQGLSLPIKENVLIELGLRQRKPSRQHTAG